MKDLDDFFDELDSKVEEYDEKEAVHDKLADNYLADIENHKDTIQVKLSYPMILFRGVKKKSELLYLSKTIVKDKQFEDQLETYIEFNGKIFKLGFMSLDCESILKTQMIKNYEIVLHTSNTDRVMIDKQFIMNLV